MNHIDNCRWGVISKFLDEVQKQKVQFLGAEDKYMPVLVDMLGEDQIPSIVGGVAELHSNPDWLKS